MLVRSKGYVSQVHTLKKENEKETTKGQVLPHPELLEQYITNSLVGIKVSKRKIRD